MTQWLALLAFFLLFIQSKSGGWPGDLVNSVMRLDPLLMLSHMFASRSLLAGSSLALVVLLGTFVLGRSWCGWICPLGTVLDALPLSSWRGKRPPPREAWRKVKYGLLFTILAAAMLGNLTLLVFDPLTILFRSMSVSIWPALDRILYALEDLLYRVPVLAVPVAAFDSMVRPSVFPLEPVFYRHALLYATVFLGIVALNVFAPRFWCRYLCPLGGLLGLTSKFALLRRDAGEDCKGCHLCAQTCPMGTIDPVKGYASDPGECTMCLDCLDACPRSRVTFSMNLSRAAWNTYDPGRREVLLAAGAALAGVSLLASDQLALHEPNHLLRPPGVRGTNMDMVSFTSCIRCSVCIRQCPTNALHPALTEAGLEGVWTPVFIPRMGYCDYSCNACGQVCPVQAIPSLSLEEKRRQVMGSASIDRDRCIAWAERRDCIICEEMCPLPDKAIQLEEAEVWGAGGANVKVKLPHVLSERCIGCGICEYKCPLNGEAAIRVHLPQVV